MPPRGSCRICDGPKRAEVDALLCANTSIGAVARRTGYPQTTVFSHAKRCAAPVARKADVATISLPRVEVDPGDPIVPLLEDLARKHEKLSAAYEAVDSPALLNDLSVQARNNLLAQAKLVGMRQRPRDPVALLVEHPDFGAAVAAVAEALDAHPEAREAVRLRLEAVVGKVGALA